MIEGVKNLADLQIQTTTNVVKNYIPDDVDLEAIKMGTEILIPVDALIGLLECAAAVAGNESSIIEKLVADDSLSSAIPKILRLAIEEQDEQKEQAQ